MSDFTTTPNYGLFKPTPNADVDSWGAHLNSNADTLDATLPTFLPISYTATGSTTARTAQDRAHDWINVKDYGALLDGTTNDTSAWAAARTAALDYGTIIVPRGRQSVSTAPTGGPTTPVLWKYDGNYIGSSGSTVVTGMGTDIIESFIGSKYFSRSNSKTGLAPVLRVDHTVNHAGGVSANTALGMALNVTVSGSPSEHPWGFAITQTSSQSSGGNNVALASYINRSPTSTGIYTCFGANISSTDQTQLNSLASAAHVAVEFDVVANGLDNGGLAGPYVPAGQGIRIILDIVGAQYNTSGADCEIGWGARTGGSYGSSHVVFKRAFAHLGRFNKACFSTEFAVPDAGANAIWLADTHTIAFDTAGTHALQYVTSGGNRLRYMVGATERLTLPDAKPAVTGSRAGNAALASLLTALAAANLITDSTSA